MLININCITTAVIITTLFKFYCRQYVVTLNKIFHVVIGSISMVKKINIMVMDLC